MCRAPQSRSLMPWVSIPPSAPPSPEELARRADSGAAVVGCRDRRESILRAQIAATSDDERKLALSVALALTVTGEDQMLVGSSKLRDLHKLCPAYFSADWKWGCNPRSLICYSPEPVAAWFARVDSAKDLSFDGTFVWTGSMEMGENQDLFANRLERWAFHVRTRGPAAISRMGVPRRDMRPFRNAIAKEGSCVTRNFSPTSLEVLVTKLGLDQVVEGQDSQCGENTVWWIVRDSLNTPIRRDGDWAQATSIPAGPDSDSGPTKFDGRPGGE